MSLKKTFETVQVYSSSGRAKKLFFKSGIKITRCGNANSNGIGLWSTYFNFAIRGFLGLLKHKPERVVYFETLSVLPVFLYKKLIDPNLKVFIHYHEYTSLEEYKNKVSRFEAFLHRLEERMYSKVNWISHTNRKRLELFLQDQGIPMNNTHHVMPNYPLKNWPVQNQKWRLGNPLKLIYVGHSLTDSGSYLKELIELINQNSEFSMPIELDIYCSRNSNLTDKLEGRNGKVMLRNRTPMPYDQLAKTISQYHIGLILYKATDQNYIYNAPNKLFEYLSCGLDVWYPSEMQGIYEFDREEQPRVIRIDFKDHQDLKIDLEPTNNPNHWFQTFAEEVYHSFLNKIVD